MNFYFFGTGVVKGKVQSSLELERHLEVNTKLTEPPLIFQLKSNSNYLGSVIEAEDKI